MRHRREQYSNIMEDDSEALDLPFHEEVFIDGVHFRCKFIGFKNIAKPTKKKDIINAMQDVRIEAKQRGCKKQLTKISISLDGLVVREASNSHGVLGAMSRVFHLRVNHSNYLQSSMDTAAPVLYRHPIPRIFFVSHDSSDSNVFSFIARDSLTNVFRCHVFKAKSKSEAVLIVRTIGQSFEVYQRHTAVYGSSQCPTNVQQQPLQRPVSAYCPLTTDSESSQRDQSDTISTCVHNNLTDVELLSIDAQLPLVNDGDDPEQLTLQSLQEELTKEREQRIHLLQQMEFLRGEIAFERSRRQQQEEKIKTIALCVQQLFSNFGACVGGASSSMKESITCAEVNELLKDAHRSVNSIDSGLQEMSFESLALTFTS